MPSDVYINKKKQGLVLQNKLICYANIVSEIFSRGGDYKITICVFVYRFPIHNTGHR
jgi:hypothetical protein